ncbi:unnamed protein product [Bursaphelenchus xylophilus]|uniref:(pine wood nematode) hypothetical protein n=1 Tax=Bursaphelenchus xylophilus TaxID=6326 RepID=A0A811LK56_BURXY|nr:unnamed protein product [Bursaphelenchus xylophilus]CAG9119215.1 unnamed protein product [Bursaphelenchus xylophilus]
MIKCLFAELLHLRETRPAAACPQLGLSHVAEPMLGQVVLGWVVLIEVVVGLTLALILAGRSWGHWPRRYAALVRRLVQGYGRRCPRGKDAAGNGAGPGKTPFEANNNSLTKEELKAVPFALELFRPVQNEHWNFMSFPGTDDPLDLVVYTLSCVIRYGIIFPIRLQLLLFSSSFIGLAGVVSYIKPYTQRQRLYCCSVYARSFSASMGLVATYHDKENKARSPGIAMSNHLTANDIQYIFADVDFTEPKPQGYTVTGQLHNGIIGYIIKMAARIAPIYFLDRSRPEERKNFHKNVVEAASKGEIDPVLLFPEGYCSNNTGVMQMRKAAFEEGINVYPIAIKQNAITGDSFWYEDTFLPYIFRVMTSWCISYDVYYMPKQRRHDSEDCEKFSARIQQLIADKIGVPAVPYGGSELSRAKKAFLKGR